MKKVSKPKYFNPWTVQRWTLHNTDNKSVIKFCASPFSFRHSLVDAARLKLEMEWKMCVRGTFRSPMNKKCNLKVNKSLRALFAVQSNFRLLGRQTEMADCPNARVKRCCRWRCARALRTLIWFIDKGQLEWMRVCVCGCVCVCVFDEEQ